MKEEMKIGIVFTPLPVCKSIIIDLGLFEEWIEGKTIFDPTAGEGNFLEAFLAVAFERKIAVTQAMMGRLYGNELCKEFVDTFFVKIKKVYKLTFPKKNFTCKDIILDNVTIKADILLGNPPWANFNDLPALYKEKLKPLFVAYGLTDNAKSLLLGSSRTDIAALIVAKTIKDNLKSHGKAHFFLPLSIFLNGDAHKSFRSYTINDIHFSVTKIVDYKYTDIFNGEVSTRYGFVLFMRDENQTFPIEYHILEKGKITKTKAAPLYAMSDPLLVHGNKKDTALMKSNFKISVAHYQKPRQGINTGGRNDLFIFDSYKIISKDHVMVSNKKRTVTLPKEYVFPLVSKSVILGTRKVAEKWALLPHNTKTGKVLSEEEMKKSKHLYTYLQEHKEELVSRKGVLMQSMITKGAWWGLLGVGPYSFAPYKVVWQAYGDTKFTVALLPGKWQANQSMHAFVPAKNRKEGERLLAAFQDPFVETFLLAHMMDGTCNWAQPGRISKLLHIESKT